MVFMVSDLFKVGDPYSRISPTGHIVINEFSTFPVIASFKNPLFQGLIINKIVPNFEIEKIKNKCRWFFIISKGIFGGGILFPLDSDSD